MGKVRLGQQGACLLLAAGYVCEAIPAFWEDIGGPESGPKLVGHKGYDQWVSPTNHLIAVEDGWIVYEAQLPPEWASDGTPF